MRILILILSLACVNIFADITPEQFKLTPRQFEECKSRAERGDAAAQFAIGRCYEEGCEVVSRDNVEAAKWFSKAAQQGITKIQHLLNVISAAQEGHIPSQFLLGTYFHEGYYDLPINKAEGFKWYLKAAEQGYPKAQHAIGHFYESGDGVLEDKKLAFKWYLKAAEQGYAKAQYSVGCCYVMGEGVSEDRVEGYAYVSLAALIDPFGCQNLIKLEKQITPSQISAGKSRALKLQKEIEANIAKKAGK